MELLMSIMTRVDQLEDAVKAQLRMEDLRSRHLRKFLQINFFKFKN